MKTFNFIVIDKNSMRELTHFRTSAGVADYCAKKPTLKDVLVIIKERQIVPIETIMAQANGRISMIQSVLSEMTDSIVDMT